MALRYVLPALAAASGAAAACSGTTTIQNSGDAMALSSCATYSGSITIATGTTDDIAIDGVRRITGSLTANNVSQMVSLSGDSLAQIDDSFTLNDVQILSTLNFPMLTAVDTVDWVGLPNLQGLSLTAGLQQVQSLSIQNTNLGSLDGVNLMEVDNLIVANNLYLNDITMQLGNVSTSLQLEANGREVQVSFPNLIWAYNMTFRNCSSVDIQSLQTLNGSLGFYSNFFDSISAPNLTSVGGSLAFVSNAALSNISMPELLQVNGGLQVANNTHLEKINGFPRLQRVGGAIDFTGEYNDVELPKLSDVRGGAYFYSTENINKVCDHFEPLADSNSVIRGKVHCKKVSNPNAHSGSLTSSGGASSSSSSGAANPMLIPGATGVLGVLAAIFGML